MLRRVGVVIGTATVLVTVAAGGASASTTNAKNSAGGPPAGSVCSEAKGTTACFQKKGDIFWVKDTKKDGYHATVYWGVGRDGYAANKCVDKLGTRAGWTACAYSRKIPERNEVTFRSMTTRPNGAVVTGGGGSIQISST